MKKLGTADWMEANGNGRVHIYIFKEEMVPCWNPINDRTLFRQLKRCYSWTPSLPLPLHLHHHLFIWTQFSNENSNFFTKFKTKLDIDILS